MKRAAAIHSQRPERPSSEELGFAAGASGPGAELLTRGGLGGSELPETAAAPGSGRRAALGPHRGAGAARLARSPARSAAGSRG